jgi:hypothetical protein
MNFHLDTLLNLPSITVETCSYYEDEVYLQLRVLAEGIHCPHCARYTEELHQNRPILIRDLPVFGRVVAALRPGFLKSRGQAQRLKNSPTPILLF